MTKESLEGPPSGLSEAERGYNLRRKTYPDDEGIVGRPQYWGCRCRDLNSAEGEILLVKN